MCHEAHPSLLGLQRSGPIYHAPKNTPRTGCIFAHTTNPQPKPFQPTSSPPMQRNTPQCGVTMSPRMWRQSVASQENVTKQCGAKQCSAKMWRHGKMRRHQTMWRQTMWRHMSSKCVFIMCLQRQVEKCVLFCQHREYLGLGVLKMFLRAPEMDFMYSYTY